MRAAAQQYGWNLNYGGIALMWRGGCIIRSAFLGDIKKAFDKDPELPNLLFAPFFKKAIKGCIRSWRKVVSTAVKRASRCRHLAPRWPFSTASAPSGFRPTCSRLNATILARTPTSGWTSPGPSFSTRTGPARADGSPPAHIRFNELANRLVRRFNRLNHRRQPSGFCGELPKSLQCPGDRGKLIGLNC